MIRKLCEIINLFKVAKYAGGDQAGEQVAFLWAKSLGGESAVKLLTKLNLLDACIDHACDSYQVNLIHLHPLLENCARSFKIFRCL